MTAILQRPQGGSAEITSRRRRILIGANAISAFRGSEPGMGWQISSRLAKYHDVTVLAAPGVPGPDAECFRDEYARYLAEHGPIPGYNVIFVDPPLLSFLFQRESILCRRTLYYTGYTAWQRKAFSIAQKLHAEQPFNLVHHLNITGYREPGFLWKLDAPFVWGPIAGAISLPPGYFDLLSPKERIFYRVRNRVNQWHKKKPRCLAAAAKASHIWVISAEDGQMVEQQWHHPAEQLLESGANPQPEGRVRDYDGSRPLRLIWSGQHIGRKALPILLHALKEISAGPPIELAVLGDGPENAHWKSLAASLGLSNIRWTGMLTRDQAWKEVAQADVMAFPSLLEGTPQTVLEAMSFGLPILCHNACGMGVAVNDDCGIRVPLHDSTASIHGFASAIAKLISNPPEVVRLSRGALRRAEELSWDKLAAHIAQRYELVIEKDRVNDSRSR